MNCPKCQKAMRRYAEQVLTQVIEIDFCPEHGVWLDVGELELLESGWQELGRVLARRFSEEETEEGHAVQQRKPDGTPGGKPG